MKTGPILNDRSEMTNEQPMFVGTYSGQTLKVSFAKDDGVKTDVSCKSFPDFIEKNH